MKLFLKPNLNSEHISKKDGRVTYDMVDICDYEGAPWASANVDLFWTRDPADNIYESLRRGQEVVLAVSREPAS